MLQKKSSVLYFFLLILKIFFDFILDNVYNYGRFSKTLLKRSLKLVSCKSNHLILLNLGHVLLPVEVYSFLKKLGPKKMH